MSGTAHRRPVWSDEFDGPAGSPPDPSRWGFELGDGSAYDNPGWGNDELQWYTDSVANAFHDGSGHLVIRALEEGDRYTSARLITKGKVELGFGRIETKALVPRGAGTWPAVWALGTDIDSAPWPACGEIDILEHVGREPRAVFGSVHGPGYSGESGATGKTLLEEDVADDFRVFAVDWEPRRIEWSVDGRVYHAATPEDVPGEWAVDHPVYLIVNVAVGGNFGGPVGPETAFPQDLLVDYVRSYVPA
jgi:beta-glucanase (GH16 family)